MNVKEIYKYNYLILGVGGEYFDYAYRDVNKLEHAKFINVRPWGKLCNTLYSIHISRKVNSIVRLPFKSIWVKIVVSKIKKYIRQMKDSSLPVCFVLFAGGVYTDLVEYNLCNELRKSFVDSKIVYFCQDLVEATQKPIVAMKEQADIVISYDRGDAKKYDLLYYNVPYSDVTDLFDTEVEIQSDICFIGAAKNRYEDIISVYETLTDKGLICDFTIAGVPKEKRKYEDKISYREYIPYKQNIDKVIQSRCILEIKQKGSVGNTLRVDEAIVFGKLLLSDNKEIEKNMWYNREGMLFFEKPEEIDIEFFKRKSVTYNKEEVSPVFFLRFIGENV